MSGPRSPRPGPAETRVRGRLVLGDSVAPGRLELSDGRIAAIELDATAADGPFVAPGFIDVHVHGWGGHDAMGSSRDLDGMARALLRRGVTSFLPTAVTAAPERLEAFADRVRRWLPTAPTDGAEPLGFNLEGPCLSRRRAGAQDAAHIAAPAAVEHGSLERLLPGLRLMTVAPETPGALDLIRWLVGHGVRVSLGHSAATQEEAVAGYRSGAVSTTHLFNAMSGIDHRAPGLAVAALADDAVYVELIADGQHVDPALWPLVRRLKPLDRLVLVSDALPVAGTATSRARLGGLEVEVGGGRAVLAGTTTLAGSVIALDSAVRNVVRGGAPLPAAVAAAAGNPAALLGVTDRGRLAVGQRADLVELDDDLAVRRVARGGVWISPR